MSISSGHVEPSIMQFQFPSKARQRFLSVEIAGKQGHEKHDMERGQPFYVKNVRIEKAWKIYWSPLIALCPYDVRWPVHGTSVPAWDSLGRSAVVAVSLNWTPRQSPDTAMSSWQAMKSSNSRVSTQSPPRAILVPLKSSYPNYQ